MIYLDPPYGIKFNSNWQVSTNERGVRDGTVEGMSREPEQVRAFRDTWSRGIHSYLSYLRDRIRMSRELLNDSGSLFVQMGDENEHLVRALLDEELGSANFCSLITVQKTAGQTAEHLAGTTDFILWYAKNLTALKFRSALTDKGFDTDKAGVYRWRRSSEGSIERVPESARTAGRTAGVFRYDNLTSQRPPGSFPVTFQGSVFGSGKGFWKTGEIGMQRLIKADRIGKAANSLTYVRFIDDFRAQAIGNLWTDTGTGSFTDEKVYVVQTATKIIERCLLMTTEPGDLVIDPTCGSGTTAYVAEQWGRRWITIDTSRVALTLTRTRLMSARYLHSVVSQRSSFPAR